jgi:DHA1 family bicyclomycin/chloramphenicol resistance-like MFS transporter
MAGKPLVLRGVVLGLLCSVGAFAVDMYTPGFAAIGRDLHADVGTVQFSMTAYFLAVAGGQVFYGPLSDAIGRRRPIFLGLALFAVGSIWAALAPSIGSLIAARVFQGLGAAATAVIPLAVIRDEHSGPDAARLMSLAMLSLSVSPVLAPTLGGVLVQFVSWRVIFGVLTMIALAAAVMVARLLPETLPPARRTRTGPLGLLLTYGKLVADRRFSIPLLIAACAQSVLLVFIAGAPFVFVTLHGVKPAVFGAIFAVHAMALIGISQFNAALMRRFGVVRLVGAASLCAALAGVALVVLVLGGVGSLWPFMALTLLMFTCLGLILAPAFLEALEPFGAIAGAAAAIGVALELCFSSFVTFLLSLSGDGTARPMVVLMALGACGSFAVWGLLRGQSVVNDRQQESASF